jgi:hypothetical protein
LISESGILIDPEWENPYFVFQNKHRFLGNANIMVKVEGQWEYLNIYEKGTQDVWKKEFFDLSKYAGKNILFLFSVDCGGLSGGGGGGGFLLGGGYEYTNEWYLQDIQIVPNFEPSQ